MHVSHPHDLGRTSQQGLHRHARGRGCLYRRSVQKYQRCLSLAGHCDEASSCHRPAVHLHSGHRVPRIHRACGLGEVRRWLAVLLFLASAAAAQTYPARPVKIVVPFPPGGGNDFIARFVAQRLAPSLGQPVIVENKPGAGGTIGNEAGLKAPPDGYTLTLVSSAYTITPHLYKLHYDPLADIAPIIQMSRGPLLAVVNPSVPANNVQELIALAKSKPGTLNFASSGQGSTIHLAAELFALRAGIRMNHIPYKGTN